MERISTPRQVGYKDMSGATGSSSASSLSGAPVHDDENADPNTAGDDPLASYFRFVRCRVTVGTQVGLLNTCSQMCVLLCCVHNSVFVFVFVKGEN